MFLRRPTALLAFAMIVLSLAAALSPSSARAADGRYALVIGNGNYATVPDLPNARTDAQHVGAKLAGIGFDVTLGLDLDATGFSNAVADFRAKLKTGNARNVVFYYSGHGFALKGYNFLVPVDATLNDRDSIGRETLALDRIISAIRTSPVQETAIFLDACRNNPLSPRLRDKEGDGLVQLQNGMPGVFVAFATQPGSAARDGLGRNSPFTEALLTHLDRPGLSVTDMMVDVRKDVFARTSGRQIPFDQSSLRSQFYFVPFTPITEQIADRGVSQLPANDGGLIFSSADDASPPDDPQPGTKAENGMAGASLSDQSVPVQPPADSKANVPFVGTRDGNSVVAAAPGSAKPEQNGVAGDHAVGKKDSGAPAVAPPDKQDPAKQAKASKIVKYDDYRITSSGCKKLIAGTLDTARKTATKYKVTYRCLVVATPTVAELLQSCSISCGSSRYSRATPTSYAISLCKKKAVAKRGAVPGKYCRVVSERKFLP